MKKTTLLVLIVSITMIWGLNAQQKKLDKLPVNPKPGKCYVKCIEPDIWETQDVRVLVKPAYKKLTVVPPKYKTVEERIMIKPESKRFVNVPAQFATKNVKVMVEDSPTKLKINPARFTSSTERIMVKPKTAQWDYKKTPNCQAPDPEDCLTACWVETPAEYQTVSTSLLASDAKSEVSYTGKPKYITVRTQELVKPATTREIVIPAQYKTIRKKVLVSNETTREVLVPAVYKTIKTKVLKERVSNPYWIEVDCELLDYNVLPIYYNLNSASLTPEAKKIIDNVLYKVLRENSELRIELASHTDSRGSADANMTLSKNRAQSVVNYLVAKGIDRRRLAANGYGETRLKNKCSDGVKCSEAQHQLNRRTEFRVINR